MKNHIFTKKYLAEFIGTFALTSVVIASLAGNFPVPTPVLAAITLGLFVYSIGHISGTHINPAVTLGIFSIGKIKRNDTISYLIAQFAGAAVAMGMMHLILGTPLAGFTTPESGKAIVGETVGAFFFTFGIASVVYKHVENHVSGLVIGGSLLLGISFAALIGSNGILNPAVAFGVGSLNLSYLFAPIIGSVLGMNVYKRLLN